MARAIWAAAGRILLYTAAILVFFLYTVAFSYFVGQRNQGVLLAALPAVFLGWLVSTLVHEAGHQLAGWSRGWRPMVFAARPFAFQFPASSFAWVGRGRESDVRGWVFMIPPTPDRANRTSDAILFAGGPAASLLLAGIAFAIAWAAPWASLDERGTGIVLLIGALGWQSAIDAVFTLLPATSRDGGTDGDKLRALWRGRHADYRFPALGYLATMRLYGIRLRETPQWMIDAARLDEALQPEYRQMVDGVEIGAVLDAATIDVPRARRLIDRYRASYGDGEWLASCDAFLAAVGEEDPVRARAVAWSGEVSDDQRPLVLAVEAAIAARKGDGEFAHRLLGEMDIARRGRTTFRDVMFDDIRAKVERLIPAAAA